MRGAGSGWPRRDLPVPSSPRTWLRPSPAARRPRAERSSSASSRSSTVQRDGGCRASWEKSLWIAKALPA
ncbi:hypothetical protein G0U57_018166 [Chelydra serpentina]|uniref:Uncharacterized protein n=1 Tax=Chelydra serpentina TaxID=8475 RepID=A0A8T1S6I6_CHESE|nr:hypothetical protein G0U57_018166 [Chelydra serpentina]